MSLFEGLMSLKHRNLFGLCDHQQISVIKVKYLGILAFGYCYHMH